MQRAPIVLGLTLSAAAVLMLVALVFSASLIWWVTTVPALLVAVGLGILVRASPKVWRRVALTVNVFFALWTLASALRWGGVLPEAPWWTLVNVSALGLGFHALWWVIADLLLGMSWLVAHWHGPRLQATA
jgi:hypothetical protein